VTEGDNAQAADALALAEEIRERVKREHGIDLEYEVELWRSQPLTSSAEVSTACDSGRVGSATDPQEGEESA
jgi:hypothetical protein